jgi:Tol biopolymer transport system component/imidazolonepropionase-like amidohydrolase
MADQICRLTRAVVISIIGIATLAQPIVAQRGGAGGPGGGGLPLVPTRPMKFTTDEGTWMSVDVSPDGRSLVFDLLGDLYTLPITGGAASRITSGQAFDAMPRFSPDGKRIAFVSDRSGAPNVWVADADGTHPRQLSRTEGFGYDYLSPTWTPDGSAVLVSHNNGPAATGLTLRGFTPFDLYLYPLAGGVGQRLTGGDAANTGGGSRGAGGAPAYLGPRFSSPQTVWYSTSGQNAQLFTLDLATGKSVRRTPPRAIGMRPIPSPDGQWLVYATRRNDATALKLRDLTTGDERWLVREAQRDQIGTKSTRDLMPGMSFTPDSKALITSYGGKLWRVAVPSGEATPIPFTAEVDQMLGASTQFEFPLNDSTLTVRQIRVPRLSPDGKRVAFVALDRVWVADLPATRVPRQTVTATNVRRLTRFDLSEYSPTWSPDGQSVAFVTWDDSTGGEIYRVRVSAAGAAAAPQRLSRSKAYYEKLAYTPDGTKLLFARASRAERFESDELGFAEPSSTHADLMWMPANGGAASTVTRLEYLPRLDPPYYGVPHFGPDSQRVLLFDANANGLYSMRLDGSDRQLIVRASQRPWNSSGEEPVDDLILSPRGGHAAILGGQNMFLATLPPGAAAPSISLMRAGASPVPLRRLTKIGATYGGWSADGRILHYSIGSSLFLYDVLAADSLERAAANPEAPAAYEPTRVDIAITMPKDRPGGTVVLRGGRVITMKGTEVIENGDVVVRNNRIAGVGARGQVAVPADARIVDVSGKTIVPGYVDTHGHMYATGWGLHRTEPWQYYAYLAYGVTTARDPQTQTYDIIDYSDRVESGDVIGPRIYTTGKGFFENEGITSLDDARNVLRRHSDYFKTETIKAYAVGDRRRRQLVAQAAGELKLSPTNEGDADFMLDLTHMLDGYAGEEHTLPTYPLYKDVVQLVVQSGITYSPVLTISYGGPHVQEYFTSRYDIRGEPKVRRFWPQSFTELRTSSSQWHPDDQYAFPKFATEAAKIAAAGGRVGVGSHGNLPGLGYHFEMWGLAMGGMPAHEILRSATMVGAQAIGHAQDLGSIETGKLADLQVLDANPLENIRNTNTVRFVMRNGRLYDAATLDEVWPRQKKLPTTQWWMARERQ